MKIDIHRHSKDKGTADLVLRNLFHNQEEELHAAGFFSVGLHPWHIEESSLMQNLESVRQIASNTSVLAIGETGLDKSRDIPLKLQEEVFKQHIELAVELNKPIIIHCVRAYNEIFSLKQRSVSSQVWVIHWFNASLQMALQLVERGFYLSFGHMLFEEKSKAFKTFQHVPLDRIFFETDDAEFTIHEIYQRASQIRSINMTQLEQKIEQNFTTCFGRKPA